MAALDERIGRKEYLGDGVYVTTDGLHIILAVAQENHIGEDCTIYLDPHVLEALQDYIKRQQ